MDAMSLNRLTRLALVTIASSACAHASGSGDAEVTGSRADDARAMCELRVESAYDVPIQAGVRAGAQEVSLGEIDPQESVEILVPCSYGAVTVFRLVERDGPGGAARLASRVQALSPDRTTTVVVRPAVSRGYLRPGR